MMQILSTNTKFNMLEIIERNKDVKKKFPNKPEIINAKLNKNPKIKQILNMDEKCAKRYMLFICYECQR